MRIAFLLLAGLGLIGGRSAAQPPPVSKTAPVIELAPRSVDYFEQLEAALGSSVVRGDTVLPESPPLRLGPIYRRSDPALPGVPLTVSYATRRHPSSDSVVHIGYTWGGRVWPEVSGDLPGWGRQPAERLGAFDDRYEAVRAEISAVLGEPAESAPLSCSPCTPASFGVALWRRLDAWESGGVEVSMALEFGVHLVESPRAGHAQRVEVRVYHPPPSYRP